MDTGSIIYRMRQAESWSQSKLAEKLGVSRVYLSQIENGRKQASIELLRKVARTFKVPLALLVAWEEMTEVESTLFREMQLLFASLLNEQLSRGLKRLHEHPQERQSNSTQEEN